MLPNGLNVTKWVPGCWCQCWCCCEAFYCSFYVGTQNPRYCRRALRIRSDEQYNLSMFDGDYPAAVSITSLKKICYLCTNQKANFCCSIRDKGKVFVAVLACILRNWSDTSSFEVPGRKLCTIIRHPRGQSEVNRQWTLAFVSNKITHCSRSWFAVLLFMCFHINAFTMTSKKSDTIRNMQTL